MGKMAYTAIFPKFMLKIIAMGDLSMTRRPISSKGPPLKVIKKEFPISRGLIPLVAANIKRAIDTLYGGRPADFGTNKTTVGHAVSYLF